MHISNNKDNQYQDRNIDNEIDLEKINNTISRDI